nr:hypothetical protein Hi04_10k_c361_00004 [uncultured bacterium]
MTEPLNETHGLLRAYAKASGSLTVAGPIPALIAWYEFAKGVRISEPTFKRHTRQLRDAGLISVEYTTKRAWYTLLKDEIEVPTYEYIHVSTKFIPIWPNCPDFRHDQFDIKESGTEIIRPLTAVAPGDYGVDEPDFDLDALQASWPNPAPKPEGRLFRNPDAPAGTVQAAGCWSCRIVKALTKSDIATRQSNRQPDVSRLTRQDGKSGGRSDAASIDVSK